MCPSRHYRRQTLETRRDLLEAWLYRFVALRHLIIIERSVVNIHKSSSTIQFSKAN
jgi:hypothetical protein